MKVVHLVLLLAVLAGGAQTASADWKVVSPPDTTSLGVAVDAGIEYLLAADFTCTTTGPVTSITAWGAWLNDRLPSGNDPTAVSFTLGIHSNIPADESPTGFAMPGAVLWWMPVPQCTATPWKTGVPEWWLTPPATGTPAADTVCWRYDFAIQPDQAFIQQGSPAEPVTYWLTVQGAPLDPNARFAWKSAAAVSGSGGVWAEEGEPYEGLWGQLAFPPGHPGSPAPLDFAFALEGPTLEATDDWGDAPDPFYPTLGDHGGAHHRVVPGIHLGAGVDVEFGGMPDSAALGDDVAGVDDEDGVAFVGPLVPGGQAQVGISASVAGYVTAYVDFNADGDWSTPGDRVLWGAPIPVGSAVFPFDVPPTAAGGVSTFARFRFTTAAGGLDPVGPASDGEVEDHAVSIAPGPAEGKWLQHPDTGPRGMDVAAWTKHLADDFLCSEPGCLTKIDIWGSWNKDELPYYGPTDYVFRLSILDNVPDSLSYEDWGHPGVVLWQRTFESCYGQDTCGYRARVWMPGVTEGWYQPDGGGTYVFPADTTVWLYEFLVPQSEAFAQEGTPEDPIVYWLSVQAEPRPGSGYEQFGWKTSVNRWGEAAVWGAWQSGWTELLYPNGHPRVPEEVGLAFRIASTPVTGVPDADRRDLPGLRIVGANPFTRATSIRYSAPEGPGRVSLDLYDAGGRHVRTLVDGAPGSGAQVVVWDGCDDHGRPVCMGVYFCRLRTAGNHAVEKLVLLR